MALNKPTEPLETLLRLTKRLIPRSLFEALQLPYHRTLAFLGKVLYHNPSRHLFVVAVTGTKGKSTTVEMIRHMFAGVGLQAASLSTIQFCIGEECEPNLYKMSVPGRLILQRFLRKAVETGCTHVVLEMTSEAARQFRHKGVEFDALVFTNLQKEHIESHGSYENYVDAKLSLARHLASSPKRPRIIVANADDKEGEKFLAVEVEKKIGLSLRDAEPYTADEKSIRFVWKRGELFAIPLPGVFNLYNALAALTLGEAMGLPLGSIKRALEHITHIPGRAHYIEAGQPFGVVVDYAHTPDSLQCLLETYQHKKIIAIIGSTGGGRDSWKRPQMGAIAEHYCHTVIIANEDPYDEDPQKIVSEIASGFKKRKPQIVLDRREAIATALHAAKKEDYVVLITGKGTDPYIMGAGGLKEPWSDARVAKEELAKLGYH